MMRNKMLMQAQGNYMELCPRFSELDRLSPIAIVGTRSPLQGGEGFEPTTKFSKRGDLTGPQLLKGGCWERGGFFRGRGGVQFSHKNKLKSELFNDKKSL